MSSIRQIVDDSVVARAIRGLRSRGARLREIERRIDIGLGGPWTTAKEAREVEQVGALVSTSRVGNVLSALATATGMAWRGSFIRRSVAPLLARDVPDRIRTGGVAILVAVVTHTVLMAILGVGVHTLGWSFRAVLLTAGAIGMRWPDRVATAWQEWQARTHRS
jgi:hypothetical protein